MPSINLSLDFHDHPKTVRLRASLGSDAVLALLRLWSHAGKFRPLDGFLADYSPGEVEAAAGWAGEPGRLVHELLRLGWIDQQTDGFQVHDWADHAGHFAAYHLKARAMVEGQKRKAATPKPTTSQTSSPTTSRPQVQPMQFSAMQLKDPPPPPEPEAPEVGKDGGKPPAPQQIIFGDLCALFGFTPETKAEQRRVGRLAADFALKGATKETIQDRAMRYRRAWPGVECSPEAILKHWDRFAPPKAKPESAENEAQRRAREEDEAWAKEWESKSDAEKAAFWEGIRPEFRAIAGG